MPVLESVAAILRQMMPDLPMPVTMTRPRHSSSRRTARSKRSSEAIDERQDGGRLGLQHLACERQIDDRGAITSSFTVSPRVDRARPGVARADPVPRRQSA